MNYKLITSEDNKTFIDFFIEMTEIHQTVTILEDSEDMLIIEAEPMPESKNPDRYAFFNSKKDDHIWIVVRNGNNLLVSSRYINETDDYGWEEFTDKITILEDSSDIVIPLEEFRNIKNYIGEEE